jgi:phosphoribosylformylglycinamidine synthase
MGILPDIRKSLTTDFKKAGDLIYIVGNTNGECGGTVFERIMGMKLGSCPKTNTSDALKIYKSVFSASKASLIQSCHDISDGGLGTAVAESAIGARLGCTIDIGKIPGLDTEKMETERLLFCESPSRFIITVTKNDEAEFLKLFKGMPVSAIGRTIEDAYIEFKRDGKKIAGLDLSEIVEAWKGSL